MSPITFASLVGLLFVALVSPAQADHRVFRQLDDMVFSTMIDARDLRWEIHDDFVESRDYNGLLRETELLIRDLRSLQDTIFDERSMPIIDRAVDVAHSRLDRLVERLNSCDFAAASGPVHRSNGRGGYTFVPATRHAGRIHVQAALKLVNRICAQLDAIHAIVAPQPVVLEPAPRPRPVPHVPHNGNSGPVLPYRNTNLGSGIQYNPVSRSVSIPVGGSALTFRIGN